MDKKNTIFCDIDGTIFKYRKFETYTSSPAEPIPSTIEYLKQQKEEAKVEALQKYYKDVEKSLNSAGLSQEEVNILRKKIESCYPMKIDVSGIKFFFHKKHRPHIVGRAA